MIDVSKMTMEEVLQERARRTELSKKYDRGDLPFRNLAVGEPCGWCGKKRYWVESAEYTQPNGLVVVVPGHWVDIAVIDLDGKPTCRGCFEREYYNLPTIQRDRSGAPHPNIPRSQASYAGDNFGSGEW